MAVADRLLANIETVVHGKRDEIRLVITALACGGHVLFEDVPGTAKTVLARAVSQSIEGAVGMRIQCTPDLQPTDVTGLAVYDQRTRDFEFRPGPIFANVVLVDEINRATPKDAVRAARGDGRAPGDRGRGDEGRPATVPAAGNGEPDRVRGDVPAARGPAGPVLPAHLARLSLGRGGAPGDRGPARPASARDARPGRRGRGDRGARAGRRRGVPRPPDRRVDRRARPRDARDDGDLGRSLRPRQPRARARSTRMGSAPRTRLRRPDGRRAAARPRSRPPSRADARQARRGPPARHGGGPRGVRRGVLRARARRRPRCSRIPCRTTAHGE